MLWPGWYSVEVAMTTSRERETALASGASNILSSSSACSSTKHWVVWSQTTYFIIVSTRPSSSLQLFSRNCLVIPPPSRTLKLGEPFFSSGGPSLWNQLPDDMKDASLVNIFKKRLKLDYSNNHMTFNISWSNFNVNCLQYRFCLWHHINRHVYNNNKNNNNNNSNNNNNMVYFHKTLPNEMSRCYFYTFLK